MTLDPAQLNNRQLIASQYSPQQLVGMTADQRDAIAQDHPANIAAGPSIPLPGGGSIEIPTPSVPDPVGAATGVVADRITGAVLGPVAEVVFGMVISSAGVALIVWALIALGKRTGVNDTVKAGAKTAGNVATVAAVV